MNQPSPPAKPNQSKRLVIRDVLAKSEKWLADKGVDSPRLSSQLVVAKALGVDRLRLFMDMDRPLSEEELAAIRPLLSRRGAGEPMAYIMGEKEFYGFDFHVTPDVLIPRPETEMLVEEALKRFAPPRVEPPCEEGEGDELDRARRAAEELDEEAAGGESELSESDSLPGLVEASRSDDARPDEGPIDARRLEADEEGEAAGSPRPAEASETPDGDRQGCQEDVAPPLVRLADFGCGSGILAVTAAKLLPNAQAVALDLSPGALAVAKGNAERHGVADKTLFVNADFGAAPLMSDSLDLVLANPPYLSEAELAEVSREVSGFEPHMALTSGPDGCECVRCVIAEAGRALKPGGLILMEVGYTQGEQAVALFRESGLPWRDVKVVKDMAGLDRMVAAVKDDA